MYFLCCVCMCMCVFSFSQMKMERTVLCNRPYVQRRNSSTSVMFYGCPGYPSCPGSRTVSNRTLRAVQAVASASQHHLRIHINALLLLLQQRLLLLVPCRRLTSLQLLITLNRLVRTLILWLRLRWILSFDTLLSAVRRTCGNRVSLVIAPAIGSATGGAATTLPVMFE
jgi:hypothetical protein